MGRVAEMRNQERIYPFLNKIGEYWSKVQDWRFGQLVSNVFFGSEKDPFYLEEDDLIKVFEKFFNELD